MKKLLILTAGLFLITGNAVAAGSHTGGHDATKKETHGHDKTDGHHADAMAVGEPGKRQDASKSVVIVMKETDDGGMIFTPKKLEVKKGQTIRRFLREAEAIAALDHPNISGPRPPSRPRSFLVVVDPTSRRRNQSGKTRVRKYRLARPWPGYRSTDSKQMGMSATIASTSSSSKSFTAEA